MDRDSVLDIQYNEFHEPVLVTRYGQLRFGLGGDMHLRGPSAACNSWGHILIALPAHAEVVLWHETPPNHLLFEIRNGHPLVQHIVADVPPQLARQSRFGVWLGHVNEYLHSPTGERDLAIWLTEHPRP